MRVRLSPAAPGSHKFALVAQLDRAPVFGTGGWRFDSFRVHHALPLTMNELELIKDTLQNEIKNPQNYEKLIQQNASNIANLLILRPILTTLSAKIEKLKEKGSIKKNYKKILNSNVIELLKMLDDPNLNENNVLLIEKLILLSLSRETKPSEELIGKEYLKIAKTLGGSEIIVLTAAFENLRQKRHKDNLDIDDIYKDLAHLSGLRYIELVVSCYQSLTAKHLFKNPWNREETQISNSDEKYVFTDLGLSFMEYLELYEEIKI